MRWRLIAGITVVAVGAAATTGAAAAEEGARGSASQAQTQRSTAVTLLTGDTVRLTTIGGRRSVTFEPAKGREEITVHQMEIDGELHMLPLDVVPYVADDAIDRELFSVDALIDQGYDDAGVDELPVIATYADGPSARGAASLDGADPTERLESIDAQALSVDKAEAGAFWTSLTGGSGGSARSADAPALRGGVEKLWLDGKVEADLDRSTRQIGAPTAWEAGIDGTGATVAVLDTGVDADHPDLAGRVVAEENFSTEETAHDGHGHGTHVASTVAGTGAASDGSRSGVAPGADLISGKVLSDAGTGYDSDIIEAMEWAAERGADVVNMSLGGDPTDGTDPMSRAVDELSESADMLFVISAGNEGPGSSTVGSPGAADSALTVGAVDRDDSLADFSSRGPRVGDLAVKPDITAPGVGIVAARAAGTSLGDPVDATYTAASGTSMAAPHVAGAAALLASQHPDWSRAQLKDALISTAAAQDGQTAYEQGGGRVDVARATTQAVSGTGSVDLGSHVDGDDGTITRDVTWTNTGESDVELSLDLELTDQSGDASGDAVTIGEDGGAESVTVPAGRTASVPVVVDLAALPTGQHTGWLTATAGDVVVHTTVGVAKEPPTHTVTIDSVSRDGEDTSSSPIVLLGEDSRFDVLTFDKAGETREIEVAEGTYFLHAMISAGEEANVIVDPELEVTDDMDLVIDARKANRMRIETPRPAEPRGNLGFITHREVAGRSLTNSTMKFDSTSQVYVTPTDPVQKGDFEFSSRWQLSAPMLRAEEPGRGGLTLWPRYERYSPEGRLRGALPVVDVGRGGPEDYAGRDVSDQIVVVHLARKGGQAAVAAAAAEAGAAMVLIAPDDGVSWWVKFTGRGTRLPLPMAVLSQEEKKQVAARLAHGPLSLRMEGDQTPDYRYDIVQVSPHRVPERIVHQVSSKNTATITARYHEMGGGEWSKEQRFAWRPWQKSTIVEAQHELRTPQARVEYVSTGDTVWRQHVLHYLSWDEINPISGGAIHELRTYRPGEKVGYDWYGGVQRPAVTTGGATRTGDELRIELAEFVQGAGATYARASGREATGRVLEDGEVIGEGGGVWGTYAANRAKATYQVELSTRRSTADWTLGTATDTVWRFGSERPAAGKAAPLPMMRVDYDVPVGLANQVVSPRAFQDVRFTVEHPGLGRQAPRVTSLKAWASFDQGATWSPLGVDPHGKSFDARVRPPRGADDVSLKVRVGDSGGGTMTQTVVGAYGLG
ncbi:subtilisin family serine protease [Nocardioides albertanoniae]|uniref:Subtilisin family serine protease n=1 Tax=Nocardioides albertanoniae TaxID=1175486 RepID=A0A543ACE7_9ACTN|nr:S8 family serine peptidase [Nocardioides albertanoniae]TQL70275.1 subtilisin family serine protease [Nocardioides albertanoniae]